MSEIMIRGRKKRIKYLTKGVLVILAIVFGLILVITVRAARTETETSFTKDHALIVKEVTYRGE